MVTQPAHLTTLGIGIGIAVAIFMLVRKNHLMVSHAIWWLMIAVASISFGAYPRLIDKIGAVFGIHYPPTLLIVVGMGFILIKILSMDLIRSEQERKVRALTQRLAILESEMRLHGPSHQDFVAASSLEMADVTTDEAAETAHDEGTPDGDSRKIGSPLGSEPK